MSIVFRTSFSTLLSVKFKTITSDQSKCWISVSHVLIYDNHDQKHSKLTQAYLCIMFHFVCQCVFGVMVRKLCSTHILWNSQKLKFVCKVIPEILTGIVRNKKQYINWYLLGQQYDGNQSLCPDAADYDQLDINTSNMEYKPKRLSDSLFSLFQFERSEVISVLKKISGVQFVYTVNLYTINYLFTIKNINSKLRWWD